MKEVSLECERALMSSATKTTSQLLSVVAPRGRASAKPFWNGRQRCVRRRNAFRADVSRVFYRAAAADEVDVAFVAAWMHKLPKGRLRDRKNELCAKKISVVKSLVIAGSRSELFLG